MSEEEFKIKMSTQLEKIKIMFHDKQIQQFYEYMQLLREWNTKINLTAIIEPEEIIVKHFIDSLTVLPYLNQADSIIDVGTGAGFPGIPIKIAKNEIKVTLLDSLNKRINFLKDVIEKLNLSNIQTIHSRAEDAASSEEFRQKYDIAIARAVAPLNILLEYLLPFIKIGGKVICMKANINEEIKESTKALKVLGGKITKIEEFELLETGMKRTIVMIEKVQQTPKGYPRKAGTPSKSPLK